MCSGPARPEVERVDDNVRGNGVDRIEPRPEARRSRAAIALALYAGVLIVLLTIPIDGARALDALWAVAARHGVAYTPGRERLLDAAVNVALFVPLGWLLHRFVRRPRRPSAGAVGIVILVAAAASSLTEAVQLLLPWRHASLLDVVASVAGAALGAWVDRLPARVDRAFDR
jgi:VanZ family protein